MATPQLQRQQPRRTEVADSSNYTHSIARPTCIYAKPAISQASAPNGKNDYVEATPVDSFLLSELIRDYAPSQVGFMSEGITAMLMAELTSKKTIHSATSHVIIATAAQSKNGDLTVQLRIHARDTKKLLRTVYITLK